MNRRTGILFVCLGNICRSPLAEGIFLHMARRRSLLDSLDIDSCGTGNWHVGCPPDPRSAAIARKYGLSLECVGRQLDPPADFTRFHYILPMDRSNKRDILDLGAPKSKVHLMRSFDPTLRDAPESTLDVPDPYYGGDDGFQTVYDMLTRACAGLLDTLHP